MIGIIANLLFRQFLDLKFFLTFLWGKYPFFPKVLIIIGWGGYYQSVNNFFLKASLKANLVDLSDLDSNRQISKILYLDISLFELGIGLGLVDKGLESLSMS